MERYSLLLENEIPESLKKQLEKMFAVLCNNCDTCEKKDECTKQLSTKSTGITESDSYADLERIARVYNSSPRITFIGMIDNKDDLFYVLKYNGDIEEIREKVIPDLSRSYKYLTGRDFLLGEIRDLRDIMKFSTKTTTVTN